jgi:indolepyruvate ferredoxin oxidoreductase alpha subunit
VARWATNEKVALEEAYGASLAGKRAMAVVKNVGLNVALDALVTITYAGCNGGLVLVVGDDPGGIGSATEQDSRFALRMTETLVMEPSNPQESKEMVREAFRMSEELQLPVVVRTTTRVCRMSSPVAIGKAEERRAPAEFKRVPWYWSTGMGTTVERHTWLREKQDLIGRFVQGTPFNRTELEGGRLGIVSTGMAYNYVSESLRTLGMDGISVLKVGTYPVPGERIVNLLNATDRVLVVEETGPFIEQAVLALRPQGCATRVLGKTTGALPHVGELSQDIVAEAISTLTERDITGGVGKTGPRTAPPFQREFCPDCPHALTLSAMDRAVKEMGYETYVAPADAGCLGLAVFPPVEMVHTNICMGSSIGLATGLLEAGIEQPVFAVIGDSAFFHTGLPALVNAVWHKANVTVIVCDNAGAAMTGSQPSPSAVDEGEDTYGAVSITEASLGCGVRFVEAFDADDAEAAVACIKRAMAHTGPAVVVAKGACVKRRE